MYKLLLCWRYLKTRYLAMVCVVSVMLGVATLIVVNSVMSGFSTKLKGRLHGLMSDLVIESVSIDGFPMRPAEMMRRIRSSPVGDHIEAMAPTVETFAMIQFRVRGERIVRMVRVIGIDPEERARLGGFAEHLLRQRDSAKPTFALSPEAQRRFDQNHPKLPEEPLPPLPGPDGKPLPPIDPPPASPKVVYGCIIGHALASYRQKQKDGTFEDRYFLEPGDDVTIVTVDASGTTPCRDTFAVCDYLKTEMSEYDASYVYVPLHYLQDLRTMEGRATTLMIRLKDYVRAKEVRDYLQDIFPRDFYIVQTWEDKQGPLLAAIAIERGILNVLLFLIIGVAGLGILAIFSVIVSEKTRDIGILEFVGVFEWGW